MMAEETAQTDFQHRAAKILLKSHSDNTVLNILGLVIPGLKPEVNAGHLNFTDER